MAQRPVITAITLEIRMPDGTLTTRSIDPTRNEALAWTDQAVRILAKYYEPGGPAAGKTMARADFEKHFPHCKHLGGGKDPVELTPGLVSQIWNQADDSGTQVTYLAKASINIVNG